MSRRHRTRPSAGQRVAGLGALLILLALLVVPPVVLAHFIGWPFPHVLPHLADIKRSLAGSVDNPPWPAILKGLALIAWAAWIHFAFNVLAAAAARVRGIEMHPPRLPVFGFNQALASRLVAASLMLITATGTMANTVASAAPLTLARPATVTAMHNQAPLANRVAFAAQLPESLALDRPTETVVSVDRSAHGPAHTTAHVRTQTKTYVVTPPAGRHHDTLWGIAERHLGSGERWHEIYRLNEGQPQADGHVLRDADLIQPGWVLHMPADATGIDVHTTPVVPPAVGSHNTEPAGHAAPAAHPGATNVHAPSLASPSAHSSAEHEHAAEQPTPATSAPDAAAAPVPSAVPQPHEATPAVTAPTATPASTADAQPAAQEAPAGSSTRSSYELFGGAGLLLAGASLAALMAARRRQFRLRRPGRVVAGTPTHLEHVEQALQTYGVPALDQVTFLDGALRTLTLGATVLPDVVAAHITGEQLTLILAAGSASPGEPWQQASEHAWTLARTVRFPDSVYDPETRPAAPYPCLVTVGADENGEWLIDIERAGALTLTGDPDRTEQLARYMAAELAANTWSDHLILTLAGFGDELVAGNPRRVAFTSDLAATAADLVRDMTDNMASAASHELDVLTGRLTGTAGDLWMPHVLLAVPGTSADRDALADLMAAAAAYTGRTAVAVVAAGEAGDVPRAVCELYVDTDGSLTIPSLGLVCRAQQMPRWLAADIAAAIAIARDGEPDMPAPAAEHGRVSDRYIDITGAVLSEHTAPRTTDIVDGVTDDAATFLPASTRSYLLVTATTADDVANLSPVVPEEVRAAVLEGDPTLDADLAAWRDPVSQRAKLALLGSVSVTATGRPPVDQQFLYTEVVAYLALHTAGVTPDQFAHDIWPHKNYVGADSYPRRIISAARTWLGTDPMTGQQYIPRAVGLVDRYSLSGALIDADLFVRLRARGQARGAAGIADLRQALELVAGVPLTGRRGGGWGWLQAGAEMGYVAAIVDVAHLVATHALATGDIELARTAAQTALRGGDVGDTGLLDMVAVCDAAGHRAEAAAYVQQILDHHNAAVDEDLPPRTYDVLRRRQWLPVAM